ncbi:MAG: GTP-binding protein [bacterium]
MSTKDDLESLSLVILGHVDHGKSTVIGRLLADTGALPEGKLDQVKELCKRTSKPFEYAFLLDALKDERDQGITIDAARCFFKTDKRRYLVFDAPGHVEFLRNMITGAAKAEAAFLVIDAHEGIKENSKRHGYIASMLGLRQISVLVNKMDLVGYSQERFESVKKEYSEFLRRLNIRPVSFVPISAMSGANMTVRAPEMRWYDGPSVLQQLDAFEKEQPGTHGPLRFPVQDIYKFTASGDERRIIAGTLRTGVVQRGDEVIFQPSGKRARIASIEVFNRPSQDQAIAGEATGFTLDCELYLKPGELMTRLSDLAPEVGARFRANLFWMGKAPMIKQKTYKLKLGAARVSVNLVKVIHVLDASELTTEANKQQVDRHDVAECVLETVRPIAFDRIDSVRDTGRFVVVDNFEIAAAGIVLEPLHEQASVLGEHVREREFAWTPSAISTTERSEAYGHGSKLVVFTGLDGARLDLMAAALEKRLFHNGCKTYCLRWANMIRGLDADLTRENDARDELIRRLGELARIMTDSGQIVVTAVTGADESDLRTLEQLNQPNEILFVQAGKAGDGGPRVSVTIPDSDAVGTGVDAVCEALKRKQVILDYYI